MCLGIPGEIVAIEDEGPLRMAKVDFGGVRRRVCLAYVPEASVGQYCVVHVGFAISVIDAAEARRTLALLESLAMTDELTWGAEGAAEGGAPPEGAS